MGVQGLWQLLNPTGRPVSLQSLEGKVLAVGILLLMLAFFAWLVYMYMYVDPNVIVSTCNSICTCTKMYSLYYNTCSR